MPITPPLLFDDEPAATPIGGSLVQRSQTSLPRSKKERAVSRLLAQVASLRGRFEREKQRLDDALMFHAAHVSPRQERLTGLRTEIVRVLGRFFDDHRLGKADRQVLRAILIEQLDDVLANTAAPDLDIKEMFGRLHGVGFDDIVQGELDDARSHMAELFDAIGLDMEVPELRPDMSEEEVAATVAQMADRMRQLEDAGVESAPVQRKTKREIREAAHAQRFAQMRKIGIGAIYKRLVKALHPDLERDPSIRDRKCAAMQEVTTAYASSDLHALLRLELEWIDGEGIDATRRTDETLDAYAQLLRQQVAQLRAECMELPLHPRYQALVASDTPFGVCLIDGPTEGHRLDGVIEGLNAGLERLSDERHGWRELRELIRMHRRESGQRAQRR
ncbi:MAG: hypothetical protein H0W18_05705 [Acidobacteria bacterium]|nr:hypothetical protein [Acidobacteriota bacterium]